MSTVVGTLTAVLVGAAFALWRPLWHRVGRHFSTLAHEMGHALTALLTGGRAHGIVLNRDSSGVTTSSHEVSFRGTIGRITTSLGGYPAPAAFAALIMWLYARDLQLYGLGVAAILGLGCLVLSRSFFSAGISLLFTLTLAAPFFISNRAGNEYLTVPVFLVSLLTIGAIRNMVELTTLTVRGQDDGSDAIALRDATYISKWVWVGVFWAIVLAMTALSGYTLIHSLLSK